MARARYDGEVEEVVAALLPFATDPGWLRYSEKEGPGSLHWKVLKRHSSVFRTLKDLQPNLSFKQAMMEEIMEKIADIRQTEWMLNEKARKEQPKVLARRLRLACRHLSQAHRKNAPWAKAILEGDDSSKPKGEDSQEPAKYVFFGWDAEQQKAFREEKGPRARREYCEGLVEPENAN